MSRDLRSCELTSKIDDRDCVVLQREVFERMKHQIYDDSNMDPREAYAAVLKAIDIDDENPDQC